MSTADDGLRDQLAEAPSDDDRYVTVNEHYRIPRDPLPLPQPTAAGSPSEDPGCVGCVEVCDCDGPPQALRRALDGQP